MGLFNKIAIVASAMSLATVPVAANAANASKLSLASSSRAAAPSAKNEKLAGGGVIVAILAAAAVVAGIVVVADGDSDSDSR